MSSLLLRSMFSFRLILTRLTSLCRISFDLQEFGGSINILGSDIYKKSGSSGNIILLEVAGFGGS